MSTRFLISAFFIVSFWAGSSQAVPGVGVECADGDHLVSMTFETNLETADSGQGFILKRETIGFCEEAEFLPDVPIPYTVVQGWPEYVYRCMATITLESPHEDVAYRYTGYFVKADGSQVLVPGACSEINGYGFGGCGNAPVARGILEMDFTYYFFPAWKVRTCEGTCWSEEPRDWLTSEEVQSYLGENWQEYIGSAVDVYGHRVFCEMAGDPQFEITGLAPSPTGVCESVPVKSISLDGLKSMYR